MKSKENLVFIGMMGSGKSSIGSMVSKKLNLNFFDIDQLIENDQKMKISKIFEIKGENFFRDIEKKITLNILKSKKGVVALGGGAFINRGIRNSKKRPLAINSSDDQIIDLIQKRSNIYAKALFEIKCDNLTKNEVVNKIIKIYESN